VPILAVLLTVSGCESGADCQESCSEDDDCASGLICFVSATNGKLCLPKGCDACKEACTYEAKQDGDGPIACTFVQCQ
jgi:flavoprotein